MTRLYLLLLSLLAASPVFSQWQQIPGAEGAFTTSLEKVGTQLWCGTFGGLYISNDNGKNWVISDIVPRHYAVVAVELLDSQLYIVAGPLKSWNDNRTDRAFLYKSSDMGQTWKTTPMTELDFTVSPIDIELTKTGNTLLFRMQHYAIMRSEDNGENWSQVIAPIAQKFADFDADRILVANYTSVYLSLDHGVTWSLIRTSALVNSIGIFDAQISLGLAEGGFISADFGQTWLDSSIPGNYQPNYLAYAVSENGVLYAPGVYSTMVSYDNGNTWEILVPAHYPYSLGLNYNFPIYGSPELLDGILSYPSYNGIYQRQIADTVWHLSTNGFRASRINILYASSEKDITAHFQAFGVLNHTVNGGMDWLNFGLFGGASDIEHLNDTTYLMGTNGLNTISNGMSSFTGYINDSFGSGAFGVSLDDDKIYAFDPTNLHVSSDRGHTWQPLAVPSELFVNLQDFIARNGILLGVDDSGQVHRSQDGGNTWSIVLTGVQYYILNPYTKFDFFHFINDKFYLIGKNGTWVSTDGGLAWSPVPTTGLPLAANGNVMRILSITGEGSKLYGAVWGHGIFVSHDEGQTWEPFSEGLMNLNVTYCQKAGDMLFVSTTNGGFWQRNIAAETSRLGIVYEDQNNNGIRDSGEPPLPNILVRSSAPNAYTTTSSIGNYSFFGDALGDTLTVMPPTDYATVNPPHYVVQDEHAVGKDFGIYFTPNSNDLRLDMAWLGQMQPTQNNQLQITISNVGTTPQAPIMALKLPSEVLFSGASIEPSLIIGNKITWSLPELQPAEKASFTVTILVGAEAQVGEQLATTGKVTPIDVDLTPLDNEMTLLEQVSEAQFGTSKTVTPEGPFTPEAVAQGLPLTYTIRFQNNDSLAVAHVFVRDSLSEKLDISTLKMLSYSHPCTWSVLEGGVLEVVFNGIALPSAMDDELASKGFVQFSIQPVTGLMAGEQVHNTALVLFNFSNTTRTNTATVTVEEEVSATDSPAQQALALSPNPNNGLFRVSIPFSTAGSGLLEMTDHTGRTVRSFNWNMTNQPLSVDATGLPAGTYFLRVKSARNIFIGKVVIVN
ncbi:MAG: T9SS type A sorting domain-containing protein [Saprospiraceae bacterium]|nr:T9SS type A sorting domain-containing protein [Saprospiraceae bacterium]